MNPNGATVWFVIWIALEAIRHGCLAVGSPGTGKSVILKAFRATVAALIGMRPRFDLHMVDFDAKHDLYELHRLFPDYCPVFDINPFVRADVFDPMGDIDDIRDLTELAAQIVDISTNSTQPFFPQAGRLCVRGAGMRHWLKVPGRADFADIILSVNDPTRLREVLRSHPVTKGLLALINDNEAGLSVLATVLAEAAKFDSVAALMRSNKTGRKVSVRSILKNRFSVLRLPYDDKSVETLAAFTRMVLSRFQQLLLSENAKNRFLIVLLDELALIPKGVDLTLGAVKGREAGWLPVFAFQSPTMARAAFGRDKFDALVSTPKTIVVLNLPAREDAEWAAKRLADYQGFLTSYSGSSSSGPGGGSSSSGWSESFMTLDNVTPGMIQGLPVPTPSNPVIEGFMATVPFKPFRFRIHIPTLFEQLVPKAPPAAPPAPRDPADMVLTEWDATERRKLLL